MADWYIENDGSNPIGPVSTDLVVHGIRAGRVPLTSRVCEVGGTAWAALRSVPTFAAALPIQPDQLPYEAFSPPAPATSPRANGWAVVDVETTGLFPGRGDRVVEVAVVVATPQGEVVDEWTSLLNPGRAVACTNIHGISSADVRRAPTFADVAGELNARLSGRVLVAHNAPFDIDFLQLEYARAGWTLPSAPYLCTLEASDAYLPSLQRRRLSECCLHLGIALEAAHTALGDARATAALLKHYLARGIPTSLPFNPFHLPHAAAAVAWPQIPRAPGREVPRQARDISNVRPSPPGALSRLLEGLPLLGVDSTASTPAAHGYVELLVRVLEDGVLTDEEATELASFAKRYGLTRQQVDAAHRGFLLALARRIAGDGKVTRDERQQLLATAEVLGLGQGVVKSIIDEASAAVAQARGASAKALPDTWQLGEPLRVGDGVAFTGCDEVERARLEGRATTLGLRVTGAVSRKTVVLVTDGSDATTGKARKAMEYGTRTVTPEVFGLLLEYVQPATGQRK